MNKGNMVVMEAARATGASIDIFSNPTANFFSSIKDDGSREAKIKIYNMINAPDDKLGQHVDEVLEITDLVAHPIQVVDEQTGEILDTLRVIMISSDGTAYASSSLGIVSSLQKIMPIVGRAPWKPAIKVKVVETQTRKGRSALTLTLLP